MFNRLQPPRPSRLGRKERTAIYVHGEYNYRENLGAQDLVLGSLQNPA